MSFGDDDLIELLAQLDAADEPLPPPRSEAEAIAKHTAMLEAMPTLDDILAASPTAAERDAEYLALLDHLDVTATYTPHPGNPADEAKRQVHTRRTRPTATVSPSCSTS